MHIAMVTDYYLPTLGGVQTAIKAAKESLSQLGHHVTIFAPLHTPSTDLDSLDPDVVALPASKAFKPDGFPFTWPPQKAFEVLTAALAERNVDVVHVHSEIFAALAGIKAARTLSLPLVQSMHGRLDVYTANVLPVPEITTRVLASVHRRHLGHGSAPEHPEDAYMHSAVARRMWQLMTTQGNTADAVVVPSAHFAAKLVRQGLTAPVHVISNGLEDSVLNSVGTAQPRTKAAHEPLKLMWCGRISPEKRPEVFVQAVAAAGEAVVANIYGDGAAAAKLQRLVKHLGVDHRVRMHGSVAQEEVLAAMQQHHAFVSSSYGFDNQPMVILEAMSCGLPIVLSDPDLGEGLPVGAYVVAATQSHQDLAAAFRLLMANTSTLPSMSTTLAIPQQRVSASAHAELLVGIYSNLLAARS